MRIIFDPHDIYGGLIKSFVFGAIIAISGCYYGFSTTGGAEGVGTATMKAVVACCVMILVADYFLAEVIFRILFQQAEPSMIEIRISQALRRDATVLDGVDLEIPTASAR